MKQRNKIGLLFLLIISSQTKEGDMEHFFNDENQVHHSHLSKHDFMSQNEGPSIITKIFDRAARAI